MTLPRRLASVAAGAFLALGAGAALAAEPDGAPAAQPGAPAPAEPDVAKLRADLDRAFILAEEDHARVRSGKLGGLSAEFRRRLGAAWAAERERRARPGADPGIGDLLRALVDGGGLPLSPPSMHVVLASFVASAATDDPEDPADRFVAIAKRVFAEEKFEDCWDRAFLGLPEVVAWRAAHAGKVPDDPASKPAVPTPPPPPTTPPGPDAPKAPTPEAPPAPPAQPERPPEKPAASGLPSPFASDPSLNLVPLDRTHAYAGPWSGWDQEIKDNRRQKRPAKAVWIDRYETTCADYARFLRSIDPQKRRALLPIGWTIDERFDVTCPPGHERRPVTNVTYAQAQTYAESLGKRLPTEDEWDRAAAGGEKEARAFPWGSGSEGRTWAWAGAGADGPVAVDEFADDRTPDGIVGLAGNVAEMVATLADRRDAPAKLPPGTQLVIRGGSFKTSRAANCESSYRWVLEADQTAPHVGFRCVMDEAEYRRRFR